MRLHEGKENDMLLGLASIQAYHIASAFPKFWNISFVEYYFPGMSAPVSSVQN